ncbi:MAG: hypothetical protein JWQ49_918 [Edaphobacter sp.]|nr:hypothetical protein [Edaphobacter sp.]
MSNSSRIAMLDPRVARATNVVPVSEAVRELDL